MATWHGSYRGPASVYRTPDGADAGVLVGEVTAALRVIRGRYGESWDSWEGTVQPRDAQTSEALNAELKDRPYVAQLQLELPHHPRATGGYFHIVSGDAARMRIRGSGQRPAGLER